MLGKYILEDEPAVQKSENAWTYNPRQGLGLRLKKNFLKLFLAKIVSCKVQGFNYDDFIPTFNMESFSSAAMTPESSISSSVSSIDTLSSEISKLSMEEKNGQSTSKALNQEDLLKRLQAKCHSPAHRPQWKGIIRLDLFKRTLGGHNHHHQGKPGNRTARDAVVIDFIAYLAAVDFLTGEVLVDSYVNPQRKIFNWCTRYSGITFRAMKKAIANGDALRGWMGARRALWDYIDSDTVLIGHDIKNDLNCLGMIHPKIVDSTILTAEAVFRPRWETQRFRRTWSLKTLSRVFLDRSIQDGSKGHSALQDAVATKDIVIFCLEQPEYLKKWAEFAKGGWENIPDDFETLKSIVEDGIQVSDYL
ncbi:hypothetical protein BO85DRAFT_459482 [Aspergillus piperis CBS 112811]|uniref:Exonuclease domain-containing protein n=1 Tax=Aspergillus piperis CBS 112811 TaxID=1448313 RepID=A0A8G1VLA6_9EURO|nr:hypothetical protein BO85DRAFT_459482 [Aspergillus piperis CBS 112811]RAH57411.1 hypothetical protein BO85DRAFT_459482 [Aspergillus piperis CBS 112811]